MTGWMPVGFLLWSASPYHSSGTSRLTRSSQLPGIKAGGAGAAGVVAGWLSSLCLFFLHTLLTIAKAKLKFLAH